MDHDDVPIASHMDVELEATGPCLHRKPECLDGVLRGQGRGASVCHVDGPFASDGPLSYPPQDQGDKASQPCEGDQDQVLSAHQENLAWLRGACGVDLTMCLSYTQRATLS